MVIYCDSCAVIQQMWQMIPLAQLSQWIMFSNSGYFRNFVLTEKL